MQKVICKEIIYLQRNLHDKIKSIYNFKNILLI